MAFFWFAFLFFSLSWKEENRKKQIIFGILSGIFTGAMSWSWGSYKYIYLAIFLTTFLIFLVEKERGKNKIIFSSWFLTAILIETLKRGNFIDAVTSLTDTGLTFFLFILIWIDYLLFESPIKNRIKKLEKIKIPNSIKSLIILVVIGLIGGLIVNPSKIIEIGGMLIE
jgi:asparagine N-glycosylation enzyme membrane subunit Stt3